MDLINWSLSAIDTIFSTRSLGSGEPVCPDGTFAAGYTRDAWERWQIVCLAALSMEDIEDIYLFGTMITGILLIGLGFALGYRKIQKTGTAVQSLTRLSVLIEAVGRAVSIETETINRNMDSITMKLTALQVKMDSFWDQNGQREQLWRYAAVRPKDKTNQSYLFWLPRTSRPRPRPCWITTLGRALQWDSLAPSPITDITPPSPTNCLRPLGWQSGSATSAGINGTGPDGCLPELDMFPPVAKLCLWCMCFCAEVFFFLFSHCTSQWSIVWGLIFFFSSLSSCKCCIFLPFPVFLFCLSRCHMYVVYVWTGWWLISLVLVTSDNKGLLLLLQLMNWKGTREFTVTRVVKKPEITWENPHWQEAVSLPSMWE